MSKRNDETNKITTIIGLPKNFWLLIIITAAICILLLKLYHEYDKLPRGILLSTDTAINANDYETFIEEINKLDSSSKNLYQYHIIAKKGLDQILLQVLREDKPEAYVRALFMDKQLKLQFIRLLWFILGLILLHRLLRIILKTKYSRFSFVINALLTFLTFFYIKFFIVIPSVLVPSKLIDIKGWITNITSYIEYEKRLQELSGEAFLQVGEDTSILYIILIVGFLIYIFINHMVNREFKTADTRLDI